MFLEFYGNLGLSRVDWVGWLVGLSWLGCLGLVGFIGLVGFLLCICSTSSRAVTRLTVYRALHIDVGKTIVPDLAQVLAHTHSLLTLTPTEHPQLIRGTI